jgi:signal transduction histidine kinase/ActR/RegA family two-component response regulator
VGVRRVFAVPLRRRLFLLAAVGIIPVVVMSVVAFDALVRQQRHQAQIVGREFARALATGVDAELQSAVSVLLALSTSAALERDDLAGFHERTRRVLDTQPAWHSITLRDPAGRVLLDARVPYGAAPRPPIDAPSFDRLLRTREPVVGNLYQSADGAFGFPVRVPIARQGVLRYVLSAMIKPEAIREVIRRQRVPADWIISIFDANGRRVARSRAHEENLGGLPSDTLRGVLASVAPEGTAETKDLEGNRIYSSFSRLRGSGWTAVPGIPAELVEGAAYRSLALHGLGILLSIAAGSLAALWVARTINRPIADLRSAAQALGRGEQVPLPDTAIEEIRDVAEALRVAADERASAEAQREQLFREEQRARATADAANRAKDEFLATLSHELRTPLNAVYGWARMLLTGQVPADATRHALETIVRNADAQVRLIDDLLDVSRIATGKLRLDVRPVDLHAAVREALEAVQPAAAAKGIRLQSVLDPRAGPVIGDPARLQQVVWNLLMNAVKFTPRAGRVQVHLRRIDSQVEIVVSDTGEGIAADVLPHVFERFMQADSSSTRSHGGLGLGLALVKHLVELHGGSVTARSPGPGKGATFAARLPVARADLPDERPRAHPGAAGSAPPARGARLDGLRVLVVDDDPESLALATTVFAKAGADVRTCLSAPAALDELARWRPDVLVSDIEMPGEDGYSLIRKVRARADDAVGRIPAVALTAYGRPQDRVHSLEAGYNMHVPKPVDPGELTTIVASVAGRVARPHDPEGPAARP